MPPQCNECKLNFSKEYNLRAHVKRKHPDKLDILCPRKRKLGSSGTSQCKECGKSFTRLDNLRTHIKHKHSNQSDELLACLKTEYICDECGIRFHLLGNLNKHKESHKVKKIIQLRCLLCDYVGSSRDILIAHYSKLHNLKIENETLEFESLEAFQSWKSEMEKRTFSSFINKRTKRKDQVAIKIEYYCHRSGHFKARGANIRQVKTQGTNKINGYCPANLKLVIKKGRYFAYYCGTHVGHNQEEDLGHLFLTKTERAQIAETIASKVPSQVILNEIRDSTSTCQLQRLHLLTKKDLYNIEKSFNLKDSSVKHENDAVSLDGLIETLGNAKLKQEVNVDEVLKRKQTLIDEMAQLQKELELVNSIEEIEVFERNMAPIRQSLIAVKNHNKPIVGVSEVSAAIKNTPSNKEIEPQRRLCRTKKSLKRKTLLLKNPSTQEESESITVQFLVNDNHLEESYFGIENILL